MQNYEKTAFLPNFNGEKINNVCEKDKRRKERIISRGDLCCATAVKRSCHSCGTYVSQPCDVRFTFVARLTHIRGTTFFFERIIYFLQEKETALAALPAYFKAVRRRLASNPSTSNAPFRKKLLIFATFCLNFNTQTKRFLYLCTANCLRRNARLTPLMKGRLSTI